MVVRLTGLPNSHSIATSVFVKPGAQFDCTPHIFDTRFFAEVQANLQCPIPASDKIRLDSDTELAQGWCLSCLLVKQLVLTYIN